MLYSVFTNSLQPLSPERFSTDLAFLVVYSATAAAKSLQPCPTHSDPMDCSLPGFSIHGIFQARVLEWGAIAFSKLFTLGG